ncbi:site-specific integrase [Maribellus sediminis]|uniref:site-specific integrase n=1 Tax=Maribellus sediminis TaxID=2696285 RepID=UPI00142FB675|nr:site-specific integrase [Maribellus sediminis]
MGKKDIKGQKTINYSPGPGINVRLRGKKLANGKISLYLDYYVGYTKSEANMIKTKRKIEYLKIYLFEPPKSPEERQKNRENLELAQNIRNKRESERLHNPEGFISPQKKKVNFFDFCQNYEDNYKKGDLRMIKGAIRLFKEHTGEEYLKPKQIDAKIVSSFKDYLLLKFKGETPYSYFARFKKILRAAVDDGLFTTSPAEGVTCPKPDGLSKAILMPEEVVKMSQTECGNPEIKRAFLFSLMTGLRYDDVSKLKFKHIQNGQVWRLQGKTDKRVYIDLNERALKLVGHFGKPEENIFNLPSLSSCLRTLKTWTKAAGITKNITWHSARHSVGTILLMNGSDIITVKNVLGHTKLEHTQKYTHVVDELKKKAVQGLPEIDVD